MKEFLKLARLVGVESSAILGYPAVCARHCTVCEGQDHHWMPECDEETGEPIMACKHCDAERPMLDEDFPDEMDPDSPFDFPDDPDPLRERS